MIRRITIALRQQTTDRDLILLLLIGGLYALGILLSNTFVNVFLWRQTNEYLPIATYNLAIFIIQPITFIIAGKLTKKIDRVNILRLGIVFLCLFFVTVLFLGDRAATYNVVLGCLLGIGYGLYWLAFNVLTFEITEPDTRDFFNGFMGALESLGGMIAPVVAGAIIAKLTTNIGYMTVFSISLALFVCAVISSFFLEQRKADGPYELKNVIKQLFVNRRWRYVVLANLFQGIREGLFIFVITIWVFIVTNSEFALGVFYLILNVISLLGYFFVSKFILPSYRITTIFIGSILVSLSILILFFHLHYALFLVYAFVIGLGFPLLQVPYTSIVYDVVGTSKYAKEWRVEYIVVLELFVNIGRICSIALFIVTIMLVGEQSIRYLLLITSQAYLFVFYFMRKLYQK